MKMNCDGRNQAQPITEHELHSLGNSAALRMAFSYGRRF